MPWWAVWGLVVLAAVAVAGIILGTVALYALETRVHGLEVQVCHLYARPHC